jgi:superkiller protein 3
MVWRKKRPCLLTGWLWYVGMLVPVIGIIQISPDAAHADRYTYLPGIGLAMAVAWAVGDGSAGWKHWRLAWGGLMIAAVGALAVCAYIQTSYWKDNESLWTRALACTSGNYVAQYNLGNALVKQGKLDDAIAHFQRSLEIQPGLAQPRYNLANALFKQGRLDEAIVQYRKSLEIEPENAEVLNNLGNALAMKGADDAAIAQYEKALDLQPGYSDAHYDLGQVLLKQGKLDDAIAQFRQAVGIKPEDAEVRNGLGKALLLKGDFDGAMACLEETNQMSADPLARWRKLGNDFLEKEDWEPAIVCYRQALKINPRSAEACADLGMAFYKKGATREAIDSWQQALEIDPGQLNVQNNLAWLLATAPDPSLRDGTKAVALATQASQLSGGGNPVILHTLAVAYAAAGNYRLAADTARRALELAAGQKQDALAATLQKEIKLYEANTPMQDAPR